MGLDQYAFARKGDEKVEIAYWRKHANLQGWMAQLWSNKTGRRGDDFNCEELPLQMHNINSLERDHKNLDRATGFFWGESHPEDDEITEAFINAARRYLLDGYEVYYYCWY